MIAKIAATFSTTQWHENKIDVLAVHSVEVPEDVERFLGTLHMKKSK